METDDIRGAVCWFTFPHGISKKFLSTLVALFIHRRCLVGDLHYFSIHKERNSLTWDRTYGFPSRLIPSFRYSKGIGAGASGESVDARLLKCTSN